MIVETPLWGVRIKNAAQIVPHFLIFLYFWTDTEMQGIVSDLENYKDAYHYGAHINKEILERIKSNEGLLSKDEEIWQAELEKYFSFLESYDYSVIFE